MSRSSQPILLCVCLLLTISGTAQTSGMYAPYIDLGLWADQQLITIQQQSGIRAFTLAFVVGTGTGCSLHWDGLGATLSDDTLATGATLQTTVQQMQAAGVQFIISFGGAGGTDVMSSCTSATDLQAAYQAVINRYNVTMLDFDIEGSSITNQAALNLRDQALLGLRAANPSLNISYTLPVLPTGLTSSGMNVLNTIKQDGLTVNVINVMAMDYGSANDNNGQMGLDATNAASSTYNQIVATGLTATVGVTPMIGQNDTAGEIFQLTDANQLLNFALANTYITRLSDWSVGRDNGNCAGNTVASPSCSGITQNLYQFAQTFEAF
jgi:hypothetical protein